MLNLSSEIESATRTAVCLLVYSGFFLATACGSQELELKSNAQVRKTPSVQVTNTPKVKDGTDQKAIRLTELYNDKKCREFFNAFPNTFEEFDRIYGYDDEKGARTLYSEYERHIPFFFDCPDVSDAEKLEKSIDIGVKGRWEADASALVQNSAFDLIKGSPDKAKEILDTLPNDKASSFWYFLFDGPHPADKEKVKKLDLLREALGRNSKQSKLLSEQHKKLVADWKEH